MLGRWSDKLLKEIVAAPGFPASQRRVFVQSCQKGGFARFHGHLQNTSSIPRFERACFTRSCRPIDTPPEVTMASADCPADNLAAISLSSSDEVPRDKGHHRIPRLEQPSCSDSTNRLYQVLGPIKVHELVPVDSIATTALLWTSTSDLPSVARGLPPVDLSSLRD